MNRKTFLKTLGAILITPKALANIKPILPKTIVSVDYSAGFWISREIIEDDIMYPNEGLKDIAQALAKQQRMLMESYAHKIMDWNNIDA